MESIVRCLSLPLPIRRCRKCKEYKRTMANLLQIIQEQNQQLQNLQRQLDFTKAQYNTSNKINDYLVLKKNSSAIFVSLSSNNPTMVLNFAQHVLQEYQNESSPHDCSRRNG